MADRKTLGQRLRQAALATGAAVLVAALCFPPLGFPEAVEAEPEPPAAVPQVSQQVPLDVEAPQLVGVAPLDSAAESTKDVQDDRTQSAQMVTLTFHIEDEPAASWPDAVEPEATEPRVVEVEADKPVGELAPPVPVASDGSLTFEGWQTEDFSHTYRAAELPDSVFEEGAELFAVFAQSLGDAEVEPRVTAGWTKFGTCEWRIDASGKLEIRPENNAASGTMSGTLRQSGVPWNSQVAQITSLVVWPGVRASWNQASLFSGCANLTSATITEGFGSEVRNLSSMFSGCSKLTSLVLPSSLGPNVDNLSYMFEDCTSLASVQIPEGFVPQTASNINGMFRGCAGLTSLTLPTSFGSSAVGLAYMFKGCSNLKNLSLPAGFGASTEDLDETFSGCSSLTSLSLSQKFGTAAVYASKTFAGCSSLTSLSLPVGFAPLVENVSRAFEDCSSLSSLVIPQGSFGAATNMSSMFSGCSNLTSVTLPNGFGALVTETTWMFQDCSSLGTLTLPTGFGKTNTWAQEMFSGCSNLTSVSWPAGFCAQSESMVEIFNGCISLTRIPENFTFGLDTYRSKCFYVDHPDTYDPLPTLYSGSDPDVLAYDWEADYRVLNPSMSGTVAVEGGAYANQTVSATAEVPYFASPSYQWYVADTADGAKRKIEGASAASVDLSKAGGSALVGKYLFCGVSDTGGLYQGTAYSEPVVVGIVKGAAGDCTWTIDHKGAFSLMPTDDSNGTLPNTSVDSVPWAAWAKSITSVKVAPYVYASGRLDYLFAGCTSLKTVELSDYLAYRTESMASMFAGCSALTSVSMEGNFGGDVTNMHAMFSGCSALVALELPEGFGSSATDMGSMFEGCSSLASLTLPYDFGFSVNDASSLFEDCSNLTLFTFPSDFSYWRSLRNMSSMFKNCSNLTQVSLPDTDFSYSTTDVSSMFEGCSKLVSLTLPKEFDESVIDESSLFKGCAKLSNLQVSSYLGSRAENTSSMFEGCVSLTDETFLQDGMGDLGHNTENSTFMFRGCVGLTSLTFRYCFGFVQDASSMFQGCSNLTSIDMVDGWFNPAIMEGMFKDCVKLSDLKIPDDFCGSATNMTAAFANCPSLKKIPDDFSFGNTTPETRKGCFAVGAPYGSSNLLLTFYGGKDASMATYDWKADNRSLNPPLTGSVSIAGKLYANQTVTASASGLPAGVSPAFQWYVANSPDAAKTKIAGATSASLNLTTLDAATVVGKRLFCEVKDAAGLYTTSLWSSATGVVNIACGTSGSATTGCAWTIDYAGAFVVAPQTGSLGTLGELAWNAIPWSPYATSIVSATVSTGVTAGASVQSMFAGCTKLTTVNLAGLSTPKAADMLAMFSGCASLKSVSGLAGLAASRVEQMFQGCSSLVSLDVAGFDTSGAASMSSMFAGCSKLGSLDASRLSTASATHMDSLFKGCSSLSAVVLPDGFVGASCATIASMFEGCTALSVIPENFTFGPADKTVGVDRCFYVGDPYTASAPLATTYLGADARVAAYDWAGSHRVLTDWILQGKVSLSVTGNVWRQGSTATASAAFDPPATGAKPSYQWKRAKKADGSDAVDVPGATTASYALGSDDVGSYVVCAVKAPDTGGRGEVAAVAPQPVSAAQVSVTVPSSTNVAISSTGMVSVPDASVYAVGNPSGQGGSTGAIRLKGVRLSLHDARYPSGSWSLGTKDDAGVYVSAGTFAVDPGSAYAVKGAPAVPVGGTMPLQWAADLAGGGIGPEFAALLADAQNEDGAAYGSIVFTVEYVAEA